jgi:hypothetical protein
MPFEDGKMQSAGRKWITWIWIMNLDLNLSQTHGRECMNLTRKFNSSCQGLVRPDSGLRLSWLDSPADFMANVSYPTGRLGIYYREYDSRFKHAACQVAQPRLLSRLSYLFRVQLEVLVTLTVSEPGHLDWRGRLVSIYVFKLHHTKLRLVVQVYRSSHSRAQFTGKLLRVRANGQGTY